MSVFSAWKHVHILVVGDVMLDRYVWGQVDRISPEAPVPVVLARDTTETLGGAGNVAANAAALGAQVTVFGVCGRDEAKGRVDQLLSERGIANSLISLQSMPTISKTRIMAGKQQCLRIDQEDTITLSSAQEAELVHRLGEAMRPQTVCIISDYGKGLVSSTLCRAIVDQARSASCPVLVDPKGRDWERYRGVDCITPNSLEFAQYADLGGADGSLLSRTGQDVCSRLGLSSLLITRGAQGMLLVGRDFDPVNIPTQAKEVFDVSGAGDTVIAALGLGLGAGMSWEQAARMANAAAGIVVGKVGTQPVWAHELERALTRQDYGTPKVVSTEKLAQEVQTWQHADQCVVFTNGCFDLLRHGHIRLLQQAASLGQRLVVGLNSDASVRRIKGPERPVLGQQDRATILAALECVDRVVIFAEDTPERLLREIQPDVLVKGGDYREDEVVGRDIVKGRGGRVEIIPIADQVSTSDLIRSILRQNGTACG
ncbi:bifunctional D-glycero-beta-D-manno-heptose-7-phosphate kinase/D-glycero-beta-D-manno-heptose 1-phosphate adenylyltransferase HldE [Desulfovermiculus halophilus]|uniref:bifunctional D-glycero-beta-D-manno-heptose-7-phosphate kinase/D-glycero-beta-D-manno-heptose 1-phosphate adenylyltransferase HldE n=1 Tax=Desulfovermiculus halophilus TaxID=339722 RepID=UPI00048802F6|nr:bifunctional D-glycero-beta-D-manno-heptose-7-phosphate kinase/D-glycero-beta-D-manno-heptose 1-phosphate adenylyltransferase HldE [Desulfovermiculus halophilus]